MNRFVCLFALYAIRMDADGVCVVVVRNVLCKEDNLFT